MTDFSLNVTLDVKRSQQSLRDYQKKKLPAAVRIALNETLNRMATTTAREGTKKIEMRVSDIKAKLRKVKATNNRHVITLKVKGGRGLNLGDFKIARPKKIASGKRRFSGRGVKARAWRDSSGKKLYPGTFVWDIPGDGGSSEKVFHRVGDKVAPTKRTGGDGSIRRYKRGPRKGQVIKRQPIEPIWGPTFEQIFQQKPKRGKALIDIILEDARKKFIERLNHQINRIRLE